MQSERGDLRAGPLALLDSSTPRLLDSRLHHHLEPDRHPDGRGDGLTQGGQEAGDDAAPPRALAPLFTIEEVGLSNRQVWAATLAELARRGDVSRAELETWLRPAGLIGRDGATLLIGAPNAVARDRIVSRLLPAVREALAATLGLSVAVEVLVETRVEESGSGGAERPGA